MTAKLTSLTAGMPIPFGGDRVALVSADLAAAFKPGDRLVVVQETGALLHIPAGVHDIASGAVARAYDAFRKLGEVGDEAISAFFEAFAANLESPAIWAEIARANTRDVEEARARGRSTTRLATDERMRADMVGGLRGWRDSPVRRGASLERIEHDGWSVEQATAPLGVVGFVFEGRPNVFADAAGVLRGGNTVAFRIGSDALSTAQAIVAHALEPALERAGLPIGAATLVESPSRAAGWAMFSDPRLSLAVARGSGAAVAELGAVARQAGIPVSLHGTGGAWMVADRAADPERFAAVVENSLDRKVCNTLNVCLIVRERAPQLVPLFLEALTRAGERRGQGCKLHVAQGDEGLLPEGWLNTLTTVRRAEGDVRELRAEILATSQLGREWEWEDTPEVSLKVIDTLDEAIALFNRYSPQFVASLISEDSEAHQRFYDHVNAPFVGDGVTRWVDGQYALNRPELGLSNWQNGRLFARGAVLAGDGVFTVRSRARQTDLGLRR
ncbi:MAG TPA: aldehyde dehydrogenase family protein [Caulobacteraceae bacterium]|nr:aldehyde dehydrogenase family protein [Caulobacteraceae bacterium]